MGLVYHRDTKEVVEDIHYGQKYLKFLYGNVIGRVLLKVATMPWLSKLCGKYYDSKLSVSKIEPFIQKNKIDMSLFETKEYTSFNDFFTRQKKEIHFVEETEVFCSPVDAKLTVYKVSDDLSISVKNSVYTLAELIKDDEMIDEFKNGNCLVFRLSVDDYHRYCAVDDLEVKKSYRIPGILHTVSSISHYYKVYAQNTRVVNQLATSHFGKVLMIEVGAMLVGKITNHDKTEYARGEEMGQFEYGGSTVILITKEKLMIDGDIIRNSSEGIETKVSVGERIGTFL